MTKPGPVRRIEVFTGIGRRRAWSEEEKARIVAESYGGLETVSAVARRYGLGDGGVFSTPETGIEGVKGGHAVGLRWMPPCGKREFGDAVLLETRLRAQVAAQHGPDDVDDRAGAAPAMG